MLALVSAACRFHDGKALAIAADADIDAPPDAAIDAPPDVAPDAFVPCLTRWANGTARFDTPVALSDINSATDVDRDPFLSHDELTIWFSSERGGSAANGYADVFTAQRSAIGQPFSSPTVFAAASTTGYDSKMSMMTNKLLLVVASDQTGTKGGPDIWQAMRASTANSFGTLDESHEGPIDSSTNQLDPFITADGMHLYYAEGSMQVIQVAARTSLSNNFGTPTVVAGITDATSSQADPALSEDELVIIFSSGRTGSFMGSNLWYATRATTSDTFGTPQPVPDVNTDADEGDAHLSADGCRLYFASDAPAYPNYNIYVASMR